MVKKLLKYEFSSLFKTLTPMAIILMSVAFFTRFIQIFENDSTTYNIFMWSSIIMLIIAMIVCLVMTVAVCVVRFYKNLFTAEGYLSLTLPVTESEHIAAKLISAFCVSLLSVVSVIVAFMIATAGEVFNETVKAAVYIVKQAAVYLKWHTPFYIAELIIGAALLIFTGYLLLYTCLSIGQLARKNRVLAAFGAFFGYYIIKQILGTIVIVCFVVFHNFFEQLAQTIASNPRVYLHIIFWIIILITAALGTLYFVISNHIIRKKLNIE